MSRTIAILAFIQIFSSICCYAATSDYDILLLKMDWYPSSCPNSNACSLTEKNVGAFTVSELIPYKLNGDSPTDCTTDTRYYPDLTSSTQYALHCIYQNGDGGDTNLWLDGWKVRGSCTGMTSTEYFDTIISAYEAYNPNKIDMAKYVKSQSNGPNVQYTIWGPDLYYQLQEQNNARAVLNCDSGYLTDVTVCLDKNTHAVIDCPSAVRDPRSNECMDSLTMQGGPPVRSSCRSLIPDPVALSSHPAPPSTSSSSSPSSPSSPPPSPVPSSAAVAGQNAPSSTKSSNNTGLIVGIVVAVVAVVVAVIVVVVVIRRRRSINFDEYKLPTHSSRNDTASAYLSPIQSPSPPPPPSPPQLPKNKFIAYEPSIYGNPDKYVFASQPPSKDPYNDRKQKSAAASTASVFGGVVGSSGSNNISTSAYPASTVQPATTYNNTSRVDSVSSSAYYAPNAPPAPPSSLPSQPRAQMYDADAIRPPSYNNTPVQLSPARPPRPPARSQQQEQQPHEQSGISSLFNINRYLYRNQSTNNNPSPNFFSSFRSSSLGRYEVNYSEIQVFGKLGKGSYGEVKYGKWRGEEVAVKILTDENKDDTYSTDGSSRLLANLQKEAGMMARMQHPNIVTFLGFTKEPPAIITEYCQRHSLYHVLEQAKTYPYVAADLTWTTRIGMLADAARGMLYLHSMHPPIIHRDLKSANLLVTADFRVKIADFNLSKIVEDDSMDNRTTSTIQNINVNPLWLAPEIIDGAPYSKASDVYSFGIIMWEVLVWELPWRNIHPMAVPHRVKNGERPEIPPIASLPGMTPAALHGLDDYILLMQRCWNQDANYRPSFQSVLNELKRIEPKASNREYA